MAQDAPSSANITNWLADWRRGDEQAAERLMDAVYPELQRMAGRFVQGERAGHTLEPNALVNELWIRLSAGASVSYKDRAHFFALAARIMRRVLIDYARARIADKRGGEQRQTSLTGVDGWNPAAFDEDLLDLDQALSSLEHADPRAAKVVELRFFGGLNGAEIASLLGISEITVKRDWKAARAWLAVRLS
jgi:RNA polymerase sigma-70 factor (ECF subfamily)